MENERNNINKNIKLDALSCDSLSSCLSSSSCSSSSNLTYEEIKVKLERMQEKRCNNKSYTKSEKICIITNMMKKGMKVEQIAVYLGVSCKTIYRICENDICNGNKELYKELLKNRKFKSNVNKT